MRVKLEWRPVEDFEGLYEVSNYGKVRSVHRTHIDSRGRRQVFKSQTIRPTLLNSGYLSVKLRRPGSPYVCRLVHRMVAIAFIPTEDRSLEVNHRDGNKKNCKASNLEWHTRQENMEHMNRMRGRAVSLESICLETGLVRTFPSAAAAARAFANGEKAHRIIKAARKAAEAYGHAWREVPA